MTNDGEKDLEQVVTYGDFPAVRNGNSLFHVPEKIENRTCKQQIKKGSFNLAYSSQSRLRAGHANEWIAALR